MDKRRDSFERWSRGANAALLRSYCLTIEDAGLSETDLRRHFAVEPDPEAFVRWFADKYDLFESRVY